MPVNFNAAAVTGEAKQAAIGVQGNTAVGFLKQSGRTYPARRRLHHRVKTLSPKLPR